MNDELFKEKCETRWGEAGRLRAEYILFLAKRPINALITLVPNRPRPASGAQTALILDEGSKSLTRLRGYLSKWLELCERERIGSRFYKKPAARRIQGYFFAEKLNTNAHLHGLLTLPGDWIATPANALGTAAVFNEAWCALIPSGSIKLNTSARPIAGAIYHTKEFRRPGFWEQMMMASDFWRASKTGAMPERANRG